MTTLCCRLAFLALLCNGVASEETINCGKSGDCVDITLIVDFSESYTNEALQRQKDVIKEMIEGWTLSESEVKVAMVAFDTFTNITFDYDQSIASGTDVLQLIQEQPRPGGSSTAIREAFNDTRIELFEMDRGQRDDCPDTIIFFSDGSSQSSKLSINTHTLLGPFYDEFFVVGWRDTLGQTGGINITELAIFASEPEDEYLFLEDFELNGADPLTTFVPTLRTFACPSCGCLTPEAKCDRTTGVCTCPDGFTGPKCQTSDCNADV